MRATALSQGLLHFQLKLGFCYENTHMYRSLSEKISEYPQKKPKVLMLFKAQPELKLNAGVIVFYCLVTRVTTLQKEMTS